MDFFCGNNVRNYCNSYFINMKEEVEQLSDAEIVSCDFQEWATYLANKYSVVPVTIFENNIDKKLSETKVKKANPNVITPVLHALENEHLFIIIFSNCTYF